MQYRAVITVDFAAPDLADLAHHEARVNRAAAGLREDYEDVHVHVVECPHPGACPDHAPLGEGARPVRKGAAP